MILKGNFPLEDAATQSPVTCILAFVFKETCYNSRRFENSLISGIFIFKSPTRSITAFVGISSYSACF